MNQQPTKSIAVVGAGIAGLAAAIFLRKARPDIDVTIFESSGRAGGVLETIYDAPYLIERSADNFATLIPDALDLCKLTGYTEELISPQPNGRQAFVTQSRSYLAIPVGFSLVQQRESGQFSPLARSAGQAKYACWLSTSSKLG